MGYELSQSYQVLKEHAHRKSISFLRFAQFQGALKNHVCHTMYGTMYDVL